jgi:Family of unknown function (DUF6807)
VAPSLTFRDGTVEFRIGGGLFARYRHGDDVARPHFDALFDAAGRCVTRRGGGDHPHQRGVWVGHRDAGGVDNWTEYDGHGRIAHRGFGDPVEARDHVELCERLEWLDAGGRPRLAEDRTIRVHGEPALDLHVALHARHGGVVLGANKDAGMIAVRVAPELGAIENAAGGRGESECWGRPAAWCAFSGPTAGVAVLDHPSNPRHPTTWHVRDYGLMAANPFLREPLELAAGERVEFRYRLLVLPGVAELDERRRRFAPER